ncbi:MAG: NAD(P)-dependent oxidoreductase [Rhodobacteraceae bacterium]|nr:NAD(P)-dependent oxidoreductase [Paracoccaceae bacterium]
METALTGRKVFVTGATGFIGRRLVARLVSEGADVSVLTRSRAALGGLRPLVRARIGSLTDRALVETALTGQDVLFNLAYDFRATAAENLKGFDALCAAAKSAGVGRIVHTSSIVVYDAWPGRDCTEDGSMARPGGSPYRQAKIAMEKRLMAGSLPAAILQPTIVYGPGSSLWTDGFAEALLAGGIVLPDPEGRCNGVFVDDVVQACLKAATLPDLGQERFIVSGPEPFAWSALLQGYAGILGTGDIHRVPLDELTRRLGPRRDESADHAPSAAARVSAAARRLIGHKRFEALVRMLKRRLSKGGALQPNHHLLEEYTGAGTSRIDHARARLGYAPDFDLPRGLAATADHLRAIGG